MNEEPNMPTVIPSVWIGLVVAVLGTATAFGVDISQAQSVSLVGLVGALAAAIPALDVWLRRARLQYLSAKVKADASATAAPTTIVNNNAAPREHA